MRRWARPLVHSQRAGRGPPRLPSPVMHFDLTDEQEQFRKVVGDFAQNAIAPHAEEWDRDHLFPTDTVRAMGELGLFGLPFPEEYGGSGSDFTTLCLAIEEIARVDQSMAITLEAGVGLGANPIYQFGTEAQRQQWLPDLCAGRALGAFGLTEPEAGSDAGGTRTRAVPDEGEWVINGEKAFITNSGTALTSVITVTVRTDAPAPQVRRDQRHRRPCLHAGPLGAASLPQDGLARVRHPRARVHRLPGSGRPPARRAGPGLRQLPGHPRRRPGGHRRAGRRGHPGLSRAVGGLRQRPQRLRQADRFATRRSPSNAPTWRYWPRPPAPSPTRRRG